MQGLLDAVSEVDKLDADLAGKSAVVAGIKKLLVHYKDLKIYRSVPKNKYDIIACCADANSIVDTVEFTDGEDGTVYAWPFTLVDGVRVHSMPPYYAIGRVNTDGFGIVPSESFEQDLDADKIKLSACMKVKQHLASKPPISYL